jgi:hypothetical protein
MDCDVAPVDQTFPLVAEEVMTVLPPAQKTPVFPVNIVGLGGKA